MKQIGRLLLGWIGFQTILAGSLLFIAIITIALGLSDLVRGLEPGLTVTTALLALAVAWGIASTRLRPVPGLALLIFAGLCRPGRAAGKPWREGRPGCLGIAAACCHGG